LPDWLLFTFGILLTIGTGLFVASEFALVNLDRAELEARRERGERRLDWTITALKRTSTHLSSAQLGITLTTLLAGYTLEPSVAAWLSEPIAALGVGEDFVRPIAGVVAIVAATLLSMLVGELIPKNLALSLPLVTAKAVVPFQLAFTAIFGVMIGVSKGPFAPANIPVEMNDGQNVVTPIWS